MLDHMRIASIMLENQLSALYRSLIPMQALAHRGHTVHIEERDEIVNPEPLFEFDVVHILRGSGGSLRRLARRLKDAGVAVVWNDDVDITTLPEHHPEYPHIGGIRGQALVNQATSMMKLADVVITPNAALAERYRAMSGADVRVLGNHLPPMFVRPERVMPHNGVTIGWVATYEHLDDFERLGVRAALEKLLIRHNHIEVIAVGLDLGLTSHRYRHTPWAAYGDLPQHIMHFDIALAPMADIPFNQMRSDVKLKEYAAIGVPWLASPTGAFAELGEEQGGRLVADDDWHEALEDLVNDASARRLLAHRGRRWAQGETIEQHVDEWERTFSDAIERAQAHAVR